MGKKLSYCFLLYSKQLNSTSTYLSQVVDRAAYATEHSRQRLVSAALGLTSNTSFASDETERNLLIQFVQGTLTIE